MSATTTASAPECTDPDQVLIPIGAAASLLGLSVARVRQLKDDPDVALDGYKNKVGRLRFDEAQVLALKRSREQWRKVATG
jgi:hypothetical protein